MATALLSLTEARLPGNNVYALKPQNSLSLFSERVMTMLPCLQTGRVVNSETWSGFCTPSFSRRGPLSGYLLHWSLLQCIDRRAVVRIPVTQHGSCTVCPLRVLRSSEVWASCQPLGTNCKCAESCELEDIAPLLQEVLQGASQ